jgi:hypothetical protein
MQYLECLAAALEDMAYTYQPAERMSTVLQAVMIELRGGPATFSRRLYAREDAVVPARRGSTNGEAGAVTLQKRQRTGLTGKPVRQQSLEVTSDSHAISGFTTHTPGQRGEIDFDRQDGFVMITPRSDISNSIWPNLTADTSSLDHPMSAGTGLATINPADRSAWMGAETPQLPEFPPPSPLRPPNRHQIGDPRLPTPISALQNRDSNQHLDFMTLSNDVWSHSYVI